MLRTSTVLMILGTAGLLTSCGGGTSSPVGGSGAPEQTIQTGVASVTYRGDLKPFVGVGANNVTVTGLAGASISKVLLSPAQTLSNTVIAFATAFRGELYTYSSISGISLLSSKSTGSVQDVCFTQDGRIAYVATDNSGTLHAYTCSYDGSNVRQIAVSSNLGGHLSWASDGKHIAYDGVGGIYVANVDGSNEYLLIANESDPVFSPDSTKLAFVAPISGSNQIFYDNPYVVGSPNNLVSKKILDNSGSDCFAPTWAPDGKYLSYLAAINSTSSSIEFADTAGIGSTPIYQANLQHDSVRYSPDGKYIIYTERASGLLPDSNQIVQATYTGNNPVTLAGTLGASRIAWSPYFRNRLFVGSGAVMLPTGAGFLWGQQGTALASMVAFSAKTPSTATITSLSSTGGSLVYQIHADSITNLRYSNSYYGQIFVPITSTTATTNVLISFDSTTGNVSTILPLLKGALVHPAAKTARGVVLDGPFSAVWDSKGHNLASGGSYRVTLSGKSVSVSTTPNAASEIPRH